MRDVANFLLKKMTFQNLIDCDEKKTFLEKDVSKAYMKMIGKLIENDNKI